jgi:hypothetical protein
MAPSISTAGAPISAHRIDCDFESGHEELFLGCLDHFPVLVMAAMRTRACGMRNSWQLEHSAKERALRWSCARRRLRRALECRRFGFGIFYELRSSSRRLISSNVSM